MVENKDKKVLNVPNLRFPEFEGEWEKCKLGDITQNFTRRNKEKIQYPMFSVTNERGFVPQSEQFEGRDMVGDDIKAYKIIQSQEFAYNPARINVGSIAMYSGKAPCMISSLYVCFKTTQKVDDEWLMQLLKTAKLNYCYNVNGEGGVRVYLFYPNFARIRVSLPSLTEQKKIACFLNLLDERISTQNKIIEDLKKLKSAIIEVHYKQCEKHNVQVADLGEPFNAGNLSKEDLSETGTRCILYGELFTTYGEIINEVINHTNTLKGMTLSKKGDLLFPSSTTVDAISLIAPSVINVDNVVLGGDMFGIHIDSNYNAQYLSYYFNHIAKRLLAKYAKGSTIIHLHYKDIEQAELLLPNLDEQNRMANCLMSLDDKIGVETAFLNLQMCKKNYLLRQMFI